MKTSPIVTTSALIKEYWMKALRALELTMQTSPAIKYPSVMSALSSSTYTTYSAATSPPLPLRNFPGPNTEQVVALRIAQSSNPMAPAVKARDRICNIVRVWAGNSIRNELNPKPASIAAIPLIEL